MKKYAVIYENREINWGAIAPELPGGVSIGETFEEVQGIFVPGQILRGEWCGQAPDETRSQTAKLSVHFTVKPLRVVRQLAV